MPNPIGGTPDPRAGRPMFSTLRIASSGLSAQRLRMDTIATNIANAETTRTEGGGPYRRRVVNMEASDARSFGAALAASSSNVGASPSPEPGVDDRSATPKDLGGVRIASITEDPSEGPRVYDPSHPDADSTGFVRYPNVRITDEIVDLMDAKRVFEANATVFQAAKSMLRRAIDI